MRSFYQLLADSLPENLYHPLGIGLNIAVFLGGLVLILLKISDHFRAKKDLVPNPVVTERKTEFVPRRDHDGLKAEVHETKVKLEALADKINAVHLDLIEKGRERSEQLTGRINDLLLAIKQSRVAK